MGFSLAYNANRESKLIRIKNVFFANVSNFVANKAVVAGLKTVYRHGSEPVDSSPNDQGRIFASPVANSGDGQGGC